MNDDNNLISRTTLCKPISLPCFHRWTCMKPHPTPVPSRRILSLTSKATRRRSMKEHLPSEDSLVVGGICLIRLASDAGSAPLRARATSKDRPQAGLGWRDWWQAGLPPICRCLTIDSKKLELGCRMIYADFPPLGWRLEDSHVPTFRLLYCT